MLKSWFKDWSQGKFVIVKDKNILKGANRLTEETGLNDSSVKAASLKCWSFATAPKAWNCGTHTKKICKKKRFAQG